MSGLQSMSLWLLGAGALALGLWVVRRQLRRRNYWIAYGLIAILVGIALLDWVIKLSFGKWLHQEIFAYVPVVWSFRDKLTLAAFATGIGAIWTLVQIWLAFKKRQSEKLNSNTGSADLNNRRDMLKMVRARWITGFLEKSLSKTQLDVGLVEIPDALVRLDILSRISGQPSTRVPAGTPILQIFNEHAEQLLILGAPGAGKTTLLLKLTRDLLSRAEKMDTDRIPVIFPLSTWSTHQPPLADWLIAELCQSYRVPKKVAEGWVTNNQILPLLDGLDEVRQECRQACVAAINKYRRTKGPSTMAVCCREFDYKAIAYNLELEGAVLVQPLARAEVSTYLEKLGEPMAGVRQLLRDDQTLWELLNTPLMVDTVTRAYQNQPVESLKVLWGLQERRNHLFKAYVDRMFQHRGSNGRYQREQTLYWLSWLADQLFKHNMTDFYIERLQVDWLPPRMQRLSMWVGGLVVGLVYGLVGGLVGGLVAVLVVGPRAGLVAGLRAGLVAGLRAGLVVGLVGGLVGGVSGPIQPVETIRWSPKKVLKTTREDLVRGLVGGLRVGLVIGLVYALGVGLLHGLVVGLIGVLVGELVFGWYGVLVGTMLSVLANGLIVGEIKEKTTPNEGIRSSARNASLVAVVVCMLLGLVGVLVGGLVGGLVNGLVNGLVVGLAVGLFVGLVYGGGYAIISHFTLRVLLKREDLAPWNYPAFLDYTVECLFLYKIGGAYRFRHALLQEYFASLNRLEGLLSVPK